MPSHGDWFGAFPNTFWCGCFHPKSKWKTISWHVLNCWISQHQAAKWSTSTQPCSPGPPEPAVSPRFGIQCVHSELEVMAHGYFNDLPFFKMVMFQFAMFYHRVVMVITSYKTFDQAHHPKFGSRLSVACPATMLSDAPLVSVSKCWCLWNRSIRGQS
jgi:hypothetical protein